MFITKGEKMRKKGLQKAFLLSAFFVMFAGALGAEINWNDNNVITNAGTPGSVWDDTLNLQGTIVIESDVYIGAHLQDTIVNVTSDDVKLVPQSNATQTAFGHLIFFAESGKKITVNCDYDLMFAGVYAENTTDFIVTFSGAGSTEFILSDHNVANDGTANSMHGATVTFTGYSTGAVLSPIRSAGTRVYITMDQPESQAVDNGVNKVLFRWKDTVIDAKNPSPGYVETHPNNVVGVVVGMGSFITYLSANKTGTNEIADSPRNGLGSLAFDPTHRGQGRMFLGLNRDENRAGNFHDGGVTVCGHYVGSFSEPAIRTDVRLNVTAGRRAIFRVIDGVDYDNAGTDYDPVDADRRGLLIINQNTTCQQLAADPYQESLLWGVAPNDGTFPNLPTGTKYWGDDYSWAQAYNNQYVAVSATLGNVLNVRKGFVVGKNGWMDVYHKTFVEHVACDYTYNSQFDRQDMSDHKTNVYSSWDVPGSPYFIFRNSSALIIDGLSKTLATDYTYKTNARIVLYGDARVLLRAAGGAGMGAVDGTDYGPWWNNDGEVMYTFSVDSGKYNGESVTSPNDMLTEAAGEPVIEVHGPLATWGRARAQAPARTATVDHSYLDGPSTEKGRMNMATLPTDWAAREYSDFNDIAGSHIVRPLTLDGTYEISDSPNMFFNASADFYNVIIDHTDVTKPVNLDPDFAFPAMIGGEAKVLNEGIWGPYSYTAADAVGTFEFYQYPRVALYDAELDMHENLVASGLRFVGSEKRVDFADADIYGTSANNTSVFRYYDHGDQLDTLLQGHGRVFMLGCAKNLMTNLTTNAVASSAFVDVYRGRNVVSPETPADTIKLSVQSTFEGLPQDFPPFDPIGLEREGKAQHLFLLQRTSVGSSHMELGWTFTVGGDYDVPTEGIYPWERRLGTVANQFSIANDTVAPATLSVDGNYIYFDGTDGDFVKAYVPVTSDTQGSVIFTNHGGRFVATQPTYYDGTFDPSYHGYDCFIDLPMAYRLWTDEALCGVIDLPKDQVKYGYGFGRQVFPLNTNLTSISTGQGAIGTRIRTFNTPSVQNVNGTLQTGRISNDRHSGEEVLLPWRNRSYDSKYVPVKSIYAHPELTRFTAIVNQPATIPTDCVLFDAGDVVTQLKVAGATIADPLHLLVTGSNAGFGAAIVREVVSIPTNIPTANNHATTVRGEGAHGAIFLQNGGSIGLGARWWNEHSKNAWNNLGKDYVTIIPDSDGTVIVNSDLIVSDPVAIVPTSNFGVTDAKYQRVSFYSDDAVEIRIPSGSGLDLSAFGQVVGAKQQQIEIGGKIRLIFEPGSTLRFPSSVYSTEAPILYLNDEAELVFEGTDEIQKGRHADLAAANADKVKIVGMGQIWVNKDAKIKVMNTASVAVQSDQYTMETDLLISIQRQGDFEIGTEQVAGGAFEVGNSTDLGVEAKVSFELKINGSKARFAIDREGFLGFGVGVINKIDDKANGTAVIANNPTDNLDGTLTWNPATTSGWEVQALYNVHSVIVDVTKGTFDHSNIYDGSDRRASLIAVGPVNEYSGVEGLYKFNIADPKASRVLGGGNVMYLSPVDASTGYAGKANVNMWKYADAAPRATSGDMYSIVGSTPILLQHAMANFTAATITALPSGGRTFETTVAETGATDFFTYLSSIKYSELNNQMVSLGFAEYLLRIGYVNSSSTYPTGAEIFRRSDFNMIRRDDDPAKALPLGFLVSNGFVSPLRFSVPGE